MPRPELGMKYVCEECGTKFYDLNKPDPACPSCGKPAIPGSKPKKREVRVEEVDTEEATLAAADVDSEDDDEEQDVEEITLDEAEGVKHLMESIPDDDDMAEDGDLDEIDDSDELPTTELDLTEDDDDDTSESEEE